MDDFDEDIDPREPTGDVFGDDPPPGVSAFPWEERPAEGWPEGYNPFNASPMYERSAEEEDEAEPDWEGVEAEARDRGYEEGYTKGHEAGVVDGTSAGHEQGLEEGRAEGFEKGVAEAQATFDSIGAAVDDLRALGAELESRYVRATVDLACRIAGRVVGQRMAEAPELLINQVGLAIRRFRGADRCVVKVNPADLPSMQAATHLSQGAEGAIEVAIEGDESLTRGSWNVETALGGVEADLEERLAAVVEALSRVEARWDEPSAAAVVASARAKLAPPAEAEAAPAEPPSASSEAVPAPAEPTAAAADSPEPAKTAAGPSDEGEESFDAEVD